GALNRDGWLQGRAVQNFEWPWVASNHPPASDALTTITSQDGRSQSTHANADGRFRFPPVSPGRYTLSAESALLGKGEIFWRDKDQNIEVPVSGCAVVNPTFQTSATIGGAWLGRTASPCRI